MTPRSSVRDDEPILATRVFTRPRSPLTIAFVLEAQGADPHDVAGTGAGPGEGTVDTQALQAIVRVGEGIVGGDVGEGHGPQRRPSEHTELPVADLLDGDAFRRRSVDDEALQDR